MTPIHLTVYRGAQNAVPVAQDDFETWDEAADELEAMTRETPGCPASANRERQKLAMLAFGPHRLREPHRKLANVEHVTLMVIDVDKLISVAALLASAQDVAEHGMIYESPSSTDDAPRVRVVCPITRPIRVDECYAQRLGFARMLGLPHDCGVKGAVDAAKLFFAGVHFGDRERQAWRW